MSFATSPLDYSILIQKELGYMVVKCPEFGLHRVVEIPEKLDAKFFDQLKIVIAKTWGEVAVEMKKKKEAKIPLPPRFSAKKSMSTSKNKDYVTPPEASKILGLHKDTVRRLVDSGELESSVSPKGSRRIPYSAVLELKKQMESGEFVVRKKGRPKAA